jgi:hypothetical protein
MKRESVACRLIVLCALCMPLVLGACGDKPDDTGDEPTEEAGIGSGGQPGGKQPHGGGFSPVPGKPDAPFVDPWTMRGRWELTIANNDGVPTVHGIKTSEFTQPISGTVAAAVKFTVSNANFTPPPTFEGVVSYGSLDIKALSDNALRACGPTNTTRCTTAALRVYTRGGGAGLWNAADAYGAPIMTGGNVIGLDAAGAYTIKTVAIGSKVRVKLSDFSPGGAAIPVPINVDFTDAPAGDYSSTIVVEYILQ